MLQKIVLKLSKMTILVKISFAKKILQLMTGNLNFPTPEPPLTELGHAIDKASSANQDCLNTKAILKQQTSFLHSEEDVLDTILKQLANYVENKSGNDLAVLESSGFSAALPPTPVGTLPPPHNLFVTTGDVDGNLDCHWDSIYGAKSYVVEVNIADPVKDADWKENITVTKSSCVLEGLTSGTRYWVRVAAIGAAGRGGFSDPATKIAP